MSEIKSTMDLVMEKTKHLSMSKEEKEAQQKDEIKKTLKGLILKFKDQILSPEPFGRELKTLERATNFDVRSELVNEILGEIDLEKDNAPLTILLKEVCGIDAALLESILKEYREGVSSAKEGRVSEIREQLHASRKISGSAVVPNLENDPGWDRAIESVKETYRAQLEQIKTEMLNR